MQEYYRKGNNQGCADLSLLHIPDCVRLGFNRLNEDRVKTHINVIEAVFA